MTASQQIPESRYRFVKIGAPLLALSTLFLVGMSLRAIGDQTRTNEQRRLHELEEWHDERTMQLQNFSKHLLGQLADAGEQIHAEHLSVQPFWPALRLPTTTALPGLQALLVYEGNKRCYPLISLTHSELSPVALASLVTQQQRLLQAGRIDLFARNHDDFLKQLTTPQLAPGLVVAAQFIAHQKELLKNRPSNPILQKIVQQDSMMREQIGHALLIKLLEWEIVHAIDAYKKEDPQSFHIAGEHLIVIVRKNNLHAIGIFDRQQFYKALLSELGPERRGSFSLRVEDQWIYRHAKSADQWILKETFFKKNTQPIQMLRSHRPTPQDLQLGAKRLGLIQKALVGTVLLTLLISLFTAMRALSRERRLLELKANFLNSVSHELKTPLTSIRLFADTLSTGRITTPDKTITYARMIQKESMRLERLVEDILNYNRLEQGISKDLYQKIDLHERTLEIVSRFEPIAQAKGVSLSYSGQRGTVLMGEIRSLDSLIGNLIDNAIKYTPAEGKVDLIVEQRGSKVVLVVSDSGIGIAVEEQEKIFDIFYRVGDEMVRNTTGSGLGLAIVQRSAKLHNAHLSLHSTPHKGTIFTVTFGGIHV